MKPSNVLVTLHDGKPVPKVIDFGVAKATNQRLTERTIYTRFAQIIGTPMSKFIKGDLDVIVMKAIEKDRTRRYDAASGLASDVQRFLNDEPIVARSPSLAYRFAKFTRRNRVAVATCALVLVSLVCGIVATSWMAAVARYEAERANHALQMFASASYEEAVTAVLLNDQEKAARAGDAPP